MGKRKIEIVEVDWGVAYRKGNTVYVNRHLKAFNPLLYRHLVNHELRHKSKSGFTWKDLQADIKHATKIKMGVNTWKFMFRRPKALVQISPVWFYKDKTANEWVLEFDFNQILMLGVYAAVTLGLYLTVMLWLF